MFHRFEIYGITDRLWKGRWLRSSRYPFSPNDCFNKLYANGRYVHGVHVNLSRFDVLVITVVLLSTVHMSMCLDDVYFFKCAAHWELFHVISLFREFFIHESYTSQVGDFTPSHNQWPFVWFKSQKKLKPAERKSWHWEKHKKIWIPSGKLT